MLDWARRFSEIKRRLLLWCRLSHEIQANNLSKFEQRIRYTPAQPVLAGWYMLSVSGQRSLLGKTISFRDSTNGEFTIQITAKPTIKRIVRIRKNSPWLEIASDPDVAMESLPEAKLTRVTTQFAVSRMRRKLAFASTRDVKGETISHRKLYRRYTQRVDKQCSAISYQDWYARHQELKSTQASLLAHQKSGLLSVFRQPAIEVGNSRRGTARNLQWVQDIETEYVCMLGSDVIADTHLLPAAEQAIIDNPDVWLFYTDHDVLSSADQRQQPCFKPGWNPEMLLSGNYIGQTIIVSRQLLEKVGAPDPGLGNSALYDWLLRASALLDESRVYRIPLVLYSYPDNRQDKAAYLSTGEHDKQVLADYLANSELPAIVQPGLLEGAHTVQWQLPATPASVDIIIPSRDQVDLLRNCINSVLEKTQYKNYRITVVDNGSVEPQTKVYYESLHAENRVSVLSFAGDFNYSALNNFAVSQSTADILLLLNNDTEVINAEWLDNMVGQASRQEVACVGAKLHYASGQIQHAGVILGMFGMAGHAHRLSEFDDDGYCGRLKIAHNVSAVTAACMAIRRSVYNEIGQLDDVNLRVAYNDVDLCLRAREAGYQNIWTPHASLYHYESISRGSEDTRRKRKRFQQEFSYMQKRWAINTFIDSAYNPNLALDSEDFSLAA